MTYERMGDAEAREAAQEARELEQERQMLAEAAKHAEAVTASPLFAVTLIQTGPLTFDVIDRRSDRHQPKVAVIAYSETGECWGVTLELGDLLDADSPDDTPGNRNYRDFDAAVAYAEAWCWEVEGNL